MKSFKILMANGYGITNNTVIKVKGIVTPITNEKDICNLIKRDWKKETGSKSFTEWAQSLNDSGEYEGTFTKFDALDNLCGQYQLNIDNKHVNLYDFFMTYLPFKDTVS